MKLSDDLAKNWPVPDEYLVELGRMSALWASLESQLNIGIGKLAGFDNISDPTPFILLVHSSFPQRLDMLGALCEQLSPHANNLSPYKEVIGQLRTAQQARNRYVHNGMYFEEGKGHCYIREGSARGKVKVSVSLVTISELRAVSESIHLSMLELHKLITGKAYAPMWER
jgi:hypothetical protein